MSEVRLVRLLESDLTERARVLPRRLTLPLPLREVGEAQMTLTEDDPPVKLHDWAELYTIHGSAGLWRATGFGWTVRKERTITWRQGIDTLSDNVWHGALNYDGTIAGFLAALLAQQVRVYWQLGQVDDGATAYKREGIKYDRLSDLLSEMAEDRDEYAYFYDYTTTPWTLSWRKLPTAVSAECRLRRNIDSCKISYDDTEMCNRLFMTWSVKNLTPGQAAVSRSIREYNDAESQAEYGVIEKTADVKEANEPHPDEWAQRFFSQRRHPRAVINIEGQALAAITGQAYDELDRGKIIRTALPDYGVTLNERLVNITYSDVYGAPTRVTVELSNTIKKFSAVIADIKDKAYSSHISCGGAADDNEAQEANIASHGGSISSLGGRMSAAESTVATLQADIINIEAVELVSIRGEMVSIHGEEWIELTGKVATVETDVFDVNARITTMERTFATSFTTGTLSAGTTTLGNTTVQSLTIGSTYFAPNEVTIACGGLTTTVYGPGSNLNLSSHTHDITLSESGGVITASVGSVGSASGTFNIADTAYYRDEVSAAETRGANSVQIQRFRWTATTGQITATAYMDNGGSDSDSMTFYVNDLAWSSGKKQVRFIANGYGAILTPEIEMPSSADSFSVTVDGPSGAHGTYSASCTVGGRRYSTSGSWSS